MASWAFHSWAGLGMRTDSSTLFLQVAFLNNGIFVEWKNGIFAEFKQDKSGYALLVIQQFAMEKRHFHHVHCRYIIYRRIHFAIAMLGYQRA